jgi:hypothetical protein
MYGGKGGENRKQMEIWTSDRKEDLLMAMQVAMAT